MNSIYFNMGVKSIQTIRSELGLDNDTEASNFIKPTVDEKKTAASTDPMIPAARVDMSGTHQGGFSGQDQVQDSALNGAQIANLVDIVHRCSIGDVPLESGKAIARASFPLLTPEIIDLIFRDVVVKKPEENTQASVGSPSIPTGGLPKKIESPSTTENKPPKALAKETPDNAPEVGNGPK